jgi:hypothetical protein
MSLVAAARRPGSGPILWAGSGDLADEARDLFEPGAVTIVPNVRPDARHDEPGPLRDELQQLLRRVLATDEASHLSAMALPRAIATSEPGGRSAPSQSPMGRS